MPECNSDFQALSAAIKKQYLDGSTADVHFVFETEDGKCERIPSQKFLLIAYSDVFRAMFNGSWKENDDVRIVDASPAAFGEFLKFFYFDEAELTMENVGEVMSLGQKYLVGECVEACTKYLMENLTYENVCLVYGISLMLDQKDLKSICELWIGNEPKTIFKTSSFLDCDREVLASILKLDSLYCSELKLFGAAMNWLRFASKRKTLDKELVLTHLGDSFYDIRFGLMTVAQVNGILTSHKNLFTDGERYEILKVITRRFESTKFSKHPRQWNSLNSREHLECLRDTEDVTDREVIDDELYEIQSIESTTFSTNVPLLLKAVEYFGMFEMDGDLWCPCAEFYAELTVAKYQTVIDVDQEISRILYQDVRCLDPDGGTAFLEKPIAIKPGLSYEISLKIDPEYLYLYKLYTNFWMKSSEVQIQPGVIVKFENDTNMGGEARKLDLWTSLHQTLNNTVSITI